MMTDDDEQGTLEWYDNQVTVYVPCRAINKNK